MFNSNFVLSYSECKLQLCVVRSDASIGIVSNKPIIASIVSQLSLKMTKHRIDGVMNVLSSFFVEIIVVVCVLFFIRLGAGGIEGVYGPPFPRARFPVRAPGVEGDVLLSICCAWTRGR